MQPATDVMFVATFVKCCIDVVMQVKGCNCQLVLSDGIATGDYVMFVVTVIKCCINVMMQVKC